MSLSFNELKFGNNLIKFSVEQNGKAVNTLSFDKDKLNFDTRVSLRKILSDDIDRIFQIDCYSVNADSTHESIYGNVAEINADDIGIMNMSGEFSIDKNLVKGKYIGLDVFYLNSDRTNYESIFRSLIPLEERA